MTPLRKEAGKGHAGQDEDEKKNKNKAENEEEEMKFYKHFLSMSTSDPLYACLSLLEFARHYRVSYAGRRQSLLLSSPWIHQKSRR